MPPPRGRPRSFDREAALRKAKETFWRNGYEGTTLTDLQEAMGGISAPSFYAAFGSKEDLFRQVVELYSKTDGLRVSKCLESGPTARDAIKNVLYEYVELISRPDCAQGCLLVVTGVNCSQENQGVQQFLAEIRSGRENKVRQRLQRGIEDGDLPKGIDTRRLTHFLITVIDGLSLQARDGVSRKMLKSTVEYTMVALDKIIAEANGVQ